MLTLRRDHSSQVITLLPVTLEISRKLAEKSVMQTQRKREKAKEKPQLTLEKRQMGKFLHYRSFGKFTPQIKVEVSSDSGVYICQSLCPDNKEI